MPSKRSLFVFSLLSRVLWMGLLARSSAGPEVAAQSICITTQRDARRPPERVGADSRLCLHVEDASSP